MWSKAVFTFFAVTNRDQFNRGDTKFFLRFAPRSVFWGLPFHAVAARAAKQAAPSIGQPRADKDLAIRDDDHTDRKRRTAGRISYVRVVIILAVFFVALLMVEFTREECAAAVSIFVALGFGRNLRYHLGELESEHLGILQFVQHDVFIDAGRPATGKIRLTNSIRKTFDALTRPADLLSKNPDRLCVLHVVQPLLLFDLSGYGYFPYRFLWNVSSHPLNLSRSTTSGSQSLLHPFLLRQQIQTVFPF